jgi:hypothetical protein
MFVAEGGALTVTVVVAVLSAGLGSTADELLTIDVLVIVSRFNNVLIVDPTILTLPLAPLASDGNVMVRFRPAPLSHTAPPDNGVQETKVIFARGRRSLIAIDAALGPWFVIEMSYVIWLPALTGLGDAI